MVVNGTAADELLDSYEAERRPIAAKALKSTGAMSNLVLGNHMVARLLRDRVIVPLMNKASLQRRVWEKWSRWSQTMTPTERSCWCVPTPISAGGDAPIPTLFTDG
jgi:4,5-epoxidase